ncbi:MAG: response regulator [Odoribacteraceae bacterium]|jgi:signal transduction histidine kinase/ligand-binding sensor domain-containing protein/DNA-binding response OmpR family regulator|nr:response regulator [Odoribacteraceae bacterium]
MRNVIVSLVTLLACLHASAVPANFTFKHLGVKEGFLQVNILALHQDENGVIWIASSANGVFRYNGKLPEERVTGLPPQQVKAILGERTGAVYLCMAANVIVHDLRAETFAPLFPDSLLDGHPILATCLRDGALYAVTNHRILRHERGEVTTRPLPLCLGEVTAASAAANGDLYLGTMSEGLFRLGCDGTLVQVISTGSKINALLEDSHGNLWVATRGQGVIVVDPRGATRQFKHRQGDPSSLVDNYVRCACEDDDGRLWFGTMFGLDCLEPGADAFQHFGTSGESLYSPRNLTVECIMKDASGTIWLGSYYTGLSYFNTRQARFNLIPVAGEGSTWTVIADIALDKRGNVWAGTSDKGLYFHDRKTCRSRFFNMTNSRIGSNNIKCVQYDARRDALWMGAFMGGVIYYDIARDRFEHPRVGDGEDAEIVHRVRLVGETLYLATYAGVYALDTRDGRTVKLLDDPRVFDVMLDSDSRLYTVPLSNRLKIHALGRENPRLLLDTTFSLDVINALLEDGRGDAWIATGRSGLLRLDRGTWTTTRFHRENCGMESDHVSAIAELAPGKIIVGSERGVSVVDVDRMTSVNYGASEGFPLVSMQNGCIVRGPHGEVFMGGMNGIAWCDEAALDAMRPPARTRFSRLTVNNRPVTAGDATGILDVALPYAAEIALDHRQTLVEIEFCPGDLFHFNPAAYHYRLVGHDDRWYNLTGNSITYMNLPPGRYELVVKERQEREGGAAALALRVHVSPPYYASLPAYALYILLIIGITVLVIRYLDSRKMLGLERRDKERQERVTHWKLAFFTNISHEFRAPLTLILGQLDLAARAPAADACRRAVASASRNAERLKLLIDELIDFRKQEQGYLKLKVCRRDVVPLLEEACDSFRDHARVKGITLHLEASHEVILYHDRVQLQKVFYNLLSNAFKHTGRGGTITVAVTVGEGLVAVSVADTGSGIDKALFETIFRRFYHHDEQGADAGMGIGLALARAIVELHGGTIRVESEVGIGSTFTVELPAGVPCTNDNVEIVEAGEDHRQFILPQPVAGEEAPPPPACPIASVLIVEDDEELRAMLVAIFSRSWCVEEAANGEEGWQKAVRQPGLVVSDVMMPIMTGYELCEKIKGNFETCHIPVVLLTSLTTAEQAIKGLECGADDYIHKPFHVNLLLARCDNLLRNREILREKFFAGQLPSVKSITTNSMDEQFIAKILRLIEEHVNSPKLNVTFLCREVSLSRTALFVKIKGITGQTPNDLIITMRLKRAASLLRRHPDLPVAEVAEQAGFNSIQYFGKAFKARFHVTPTAFRDGAGGDGPAPL